MVKPVTRPLVKCCGMTDACLAEYALKQGADAIGLVFVKNTPRYVSVEQAKKIAGVVKTRKHCAVGVFANQPLQQVVQIYREVSLGAVQLHGEETAAYCRELRNMLAVDQGSSWPFLVKAFSVSGPEVLEQIPAYHPYVDAVLLDAYVPQRLGGTGKIFNWELAIEFANRWPSKPVIIAGGLHSGNVGKLLTRITPLGMDVSSGIEVSPGKKSFEKIAAFIKAVKGEVKNHDFFSGGSEAR